MHTKVRQHIRKMNEEYTFKANKGKKKMIFEPGDWVWMLIKEKGFLA